VKNCIAWIETSSLWNDTDIGSSYLLGVYVAPHRDGLGKLEQSSGKMINKQQV